MGYFSNGSEGDAYRARYCDHCQEDVDGECEIWIAHLVFNGDPTHRERLGKLIPETSDGLGNGQCVEFVPITRNPKGA